MKLGNSAVEESESRKVVESKMDNKPNATSSNGMISTQTQHLSSPMVASKHPTKIAAVPAISKGPVKKRRYKRKYKRTPKAADAPRRPLSAYNLFFKRERALILADQNGTGSDKGSDGDTPPPALPSSGADTPDTPLQAPSPVPSSVPSSSGEAITKASSPIVIGGSYSGMLSTLGHTVVQPVEGAKKRQLKRTHRKTHGKIGFADLARLISSRWKSLDDETRRPYEEQAKVERARYQEELNKYRERKEREEKEAEAKQDAKKTGMETALISGASTLLSDLPDGSVVQPTNGISSLMMPPVVPMFSPQPPSSLSYVCNGKAYPAT